MSGSVVLAAGSVVAADDGGAGWFFGGFVLVWLVLMLATVAAYVFGIWAVVEIARYRDDEFDALGLNRTTWLVLTLVGLVVCQVMALVVGLLFVVRHRPRLAAWRAEHPVVPPTVWYGPPAGYAPPGGYGPPGSWAPPGAAPSGPSVPEQPPPPPPPPPPPAPPAGGAPSGDR